MTITSHAATKTIKHTIKKGESLYTIAKKNHTTIDTLCKLNHITKKSVLKAGKTLKVPASKYVKKDTKKRHVSTKSSRYKVKKGDTLSSLAHHYHTSIKAIREANGLAKADVLKVVQYLHIPSKKAKVQRSRIAKKHTKREEKKLAITLKRIDSERISTVSTKKKHSSFSLSDIVFGSSGDKVSPKSKRMIELAKKKLGKRYVWGAVGQKNTFDCSGLTSYVCKANGIHIPRRAIEQSKYGKYVPRDKLQPGDLVFFDTYFCTRENNPVTMCPTMCSWINPWLIRRKRPSTP
jgi:cell wall-associated NlpC family hydrolase